jgi:hypothetical protein
MKRRNGSMEDLITEIQYVLHDRGDLGARLVLYIARRIYAVAHVLLLGLVRYCGRRRAARRLR